MSPTSAGLILLWLVVVILTFAMVGLRQQLRVLQFGAATADSSAAPAARGKSAEGLALDAGSDGALLLLVSEGCPVCHEVMPEFAAAASRQGGETLSWIILSRGPIDIPAAASSVATLAAPATFNSIDPGYRPALVAVDRQAQVLQVLAAGSPDAIQDGVRRSLSLLNSRSRTPR